MPDPVAGTPAAGTPAQTISPEAALAAMASMRAELAELDKLSGTAKERHILDKNFKLRRKIEQLRIDNAKLAEAAPKDGALVLSKDDAAEYQAFKKLNLKAADLEKTIKEHGELKAKDAERSEEELFADAAEALGFENLPLFMRTMMREGLHLEFKDERVKDDETGKTETVRVPMVRAKADDKAQLAPLAEYLETELGTEFITAFQIAPDEGEGAEEAEGEERSGSESFTRTASRVSAGDPDARRAAARSAQRGTSNGSNGVRIPVTRNARPSTGASRDAKKEKEAFEEKARNPIYAGL
jgi:hypothetical protein